MSAVKKLKIESDEESLCQSQTIPIYEYPPPKYSAERILQIMLDPALESSGKNGTTRPTIVTRSSTFIVDLSKLAHPDIKNDNYGLRNHSGSHPQQFVVEIKKGGYVLLRNVIQVQKETM